MTQQKYSTDQRLRKVFDTVYREIDQLQSVDKHDLKRQLDTVARTNRRILGLSMAVIAISVLFVVLMFALQAVGNHVAWVNRPSFAERLSAPYALESKLPPYLLNAVTVDAEVEELLSFTTANIEYYSATEQPISSQLLSTVAKLQSIVPATIGDFSLQVNRTQSTLLAQCLLFTGAREDGSCNMIYSAEFLEAANFVGSEGNNLSLVMTKFADNGQASTTIESMYHYARQIGRVGNFALTDLLNVDYFYSTTRHAVSFTWSNANWVLSVSADNFEAIEAFMEAFPLYENNPNLDSLSVEQINTN